MIIQVKIIITIAVFALSSIALSAQNLSIKEIDSRDYPLLKASFYLAGADAEPVNSIDISDLKIFENGSEQVVLNVSCADSVQSLSLSSVLSVDISGSMKGKGLELAKAGTELWFDLIDTGKSECAFTTFNQYSYVNNDLTRDTEALRQSLDNLPAEGGTNYTSAFLDPYTGALTVAANGRNKKIVVFLTDGIAEIDTQSVIQYARIINAEIHCLTIDTDMPAELKAIALATGGSYKGSINSAAEIKAAYMNILFESSGTEPCLAEWETSGCDLRAEIKLNYLPAGISSNYDYERPDDLLPEIHYPDGNKINFGNIYPLDEKKLSISIEAENSDIYIQRIDESGSIFTVNSYGGPPPPFVLKKGNSRQLEISYTPEDSLFTSGYFDILSDACRGGRFFVTGGSLSGSANDSVLKVVFPNGGEIFSAGTDSLIIWEGVSESDSVQLDYSSNGITWHRITNNAAESNYRWEMPLIPGDDYVVRARYLSGEKNYNKIKEFQAHSDTLYSLNWKKVGNTLVSSGSGDSLILMNSSDFSVVNSVKSFAIQPKNISLSPDGNFAAIAGERDFIGLINLNLGLIMNGLSSNDTELTAVDWCHGDSRLVAGGDSKGKIYIWRYSDTSRLAAYDHLSSSVKTIKWKPTGLKFAAADANGMIILGDFNAPGAVDTLTVDSASINDMEWSPNGNNLALGGRGDTLWLWDSNNGIKLTYFAVNGEIRDIAWDPLGKYVAVIENSNKLKIWNILTEEPYFFYTENEASIQSIDWRFDANYLALGLGNGKIKFISPKDVPYESEVLLQDKSDAAFSIIEPELDLEDFDFGEISAGGRKVLLINDAVVNISRASVTIDSLSINSENGNDFQILNAPESISLNSGDSLPVEIEFRRDSPGDASAQLSVYTKTKLFTSDINGSASESIPFLADKLINFGNVNIGGRSSIIKKLIVNRSTSNLTITEIENTGPDDKHFTCLTQGGFDIAPGDTGELEVEFTPENTGKTSGSLLIKNNPGYPLTVNLFGEGTAPQVSAVKEINIAPIDCDISSADTVISITNSGDGYLAINSAIFNNDYFNVINISADTVLPGDKVDIHVGFRPPEAGYYNSELIINTNQTEDAGNSYLINVSARKDTSSIAISEKILEIREIPEGDSADFEFTVTNTGTMPYNIELPESKGLFNPISTNPEEISPGESSKVIIRFNGATETGTYTYEAVFNDDCGFQQKITLIATAGSNLAEIAANSSIEFDTLLCDSQNSVRTLFIQNSGSTPLYISTINITGADSADFSFIGGAVENIEIEPEESMQFSIRFSAMEEGKKTAGLHILSNAINEPDGLTIVSLSGHKDITDFRFESDFMIFDEIRQSIESRSSIILSNEGSVPIEWSYDGSGDYFVVEDVYPEITKPGGTSVVTVKFNGGMAGNTYEEFIEFEGLCGIRRGFTALADVNGYPHASLSAGNKEAYPGDTVSISLKMNNLEQGVNLVDYSYSTVIMMNANLLIPTANTPEGIIEKGLRIIELDSLELIGSSVIARLEFIAALGDTVYTPIILERTRSDNEEIFISEVDGSFRLLGVCEEGGTRLIEDTGVLALFMNKPNPADDITYFPMNLIESGRTVIKLFDIYGSELETVAAFDAEPGYYEIPLITAKYPNGVYYITLKTPGGVYIRKFLISR